MIRFLDVAERAFHLFFLFAMIFLVLPFSISFFLAIIVLALTYFQKYSVYILRFSNFSIWFFLPIWSGENKSIIFSKYSAIEVCLTRILILTFIYLIGFLLMGRRSQKVLFYFLCSVVLVFSIFYSIDFQPYTVTSKIDLFLRIFSYFISILCFSIFFSVQGLGYKEKIKNLHLLFPFWNTSTRVPIRYSDDPLDFTLVQRQQTTLAMLRKNSLFVLYILVLVFLALAINFLIHGTSKVTEFSIQFENPFEFNLGVARLRDFSSGFFGPGSNSVFGNWTSVIFAFILAYCFLTIKVHISIAIARACGYWIPANLNEPWKSKTLAQFYGRILFHYNKILMEIYFPLFKYLFSFIKNKRLRMYLSLFFAVQLGGFYFHFFRDFYKIFNGNALQTLGSYSPTLIYFSSISFIVVGGIFLKRKERRVRRIHFPTGVRVLLYLAIWSLVYTLYIATFHNKTSFGVYLRFMKTLFFLGE